VTTHAHVILSAPSADVLAENRTQLASDRTVMAADRTLMAWVRTALSMSGFGFTMYKLLEGIPPQVHTLGHPNAPRSIGLFLTALGTVSMLMGMMEYVEGLRAMRPTREVSLARGVFVLSVIVTLLDAGLFVAILRRL
jgi:putative membrane protein